MGDRKGSPLDFGRVSCDWDEENKTLLRGDWYSVAEGHGGFESPGGLVLGWRCGPEQARCNLGAMTLSRRASAVYVRLRVAFVSTGCHSKVAELALLFTGEVASETSLMRCFGKRTINPGRADAEARAVCGLPRALARGWPGADSQPALCSPCTEASWDGRRKGHLSEICSCTGLLRSLGTEGPCAPAVAMTFSTCTSQHGTFDVSETSRPPACG